MKIALVFPGYGSQHVGMGKELYDEYRIVQEYFEEASNCTAINFVKLCFASSDAEISKLVNGYSSLFVLSCAIFALLKENGITPDVVAGYNNGEVAAFYAAGCFNFPDGVYLLLKQCSFFQELLDAMDIEVIRIKNVTLSDSSPSIENICRQMSDDSGIVYVAFYNQYNDYTIVGSSSKIKQLHDKLEEIDGDITIEYISPAVGLHCAMMNTVVEQFKIYLEKVDFKDVTLPIISGIDGEKIIQGDVLKDRFIRYANEPVNFVAVMDGLHDYDIIIVPLPAQELVELLKIRYPHKTVIAIEKKSDIEACKEIIQVST